MPKHSVFIAFFFLLPLVQGQLRRGLNDTAWKLKHDGSRWKQNGSGGGGKRADAGEPLYLTPYIESGDLDTARSLSRVGPLLGLSPEEQPESFSGFITVGDPQTDSNMFFWFVPAIDVDPSSAPVSTWLQGGPGSSSLYGMLELNGPFLINYYRDEEDGSIKYRAEMNEFGWAKVANMLYIDNPVGAGYSYSTPQGLPNNQEEIGDNLYDFLVQWFKLFPEYQTNQFYAFGESYAGKYIPTIATRILAENPTAEIPINLAGLGIGDGTLSPEDQYVYGDFLFEIGFADQALRDQIKDIERGISESAAEGDYFGAYQAWDEVLDFFIVETRCENYYDFTLCAYPIEEGNYRDFLALDETKSAIHVGERPFGEQSDACYAALITDICRSKRDEIAALMEEMPVLLYQGGFDIICNSAGMLNVLEAMEGWSGIEEYRQTRRSIYTVEGEFETAGYLKSVGNLRLLFIRNAGHAVPETQPKVALDMFRRFISGEL